MIISFLDARNVVTKNKIAQFHYSFKDIFQVLHRG